MASWGGAGQGIVKEKMYVNLVVVNVTLRHIYQEMPQDLIFLRKNRWYL